MAWLLCVFGVGVFRLNAQESVRPSTFGFNALKAEKQKPAFRNYNLKMRDVTVDVSGGIEFEFNDNVGISQVDRQSDLLIRPQLRLNTEWQASQLNTLKLNVGIGYTKYLSNNQLDTQTLMVDPGTELTFDVYIGETLRLNFHERLSIVQNPIDDPSLSNALRFDRFQNALGVTAYWDLNDVNVSLGYDNYTYIALGEDFSYMNRQEQQFSGTVGLRISDALSVGMEAQVALVNFEENYNNDANSGSLGFTADAALSSYTKLRLAVGGQFMLFSSGGESGDTDDFTGWYGNISVVNRLNQHWSHTLTVGREARLGLAVNFSDYIFARYAAEWRASSRLSLSMETFVESADESGGVEQGSEKAFRYGAGVSTSWRINEKLVLGLRYRYVNKDSDQILRSYYQNVGTISLNYDF